MQHAVALDARRGRHVVGLRLAHERVDEQSVDGLEGALRQVLVGAVDRVAGLEADDAPPAPVGELRPRLRRIARQLREGGLRSVEDGDLAGEVEILLRVEPSDPGMRLVGRPEALLGLPLLVVLVDLLDVEHGEWTAALVREDDPVAARRRRDRQGDGQRPREAACEPHVVHDPLVVLLAHEALERRERAGREHVQVGHFTRRERDRLERLEVGGPFAGPVDERPPMWLDQTCPGDCPHDMAHAGTSSSTRPSSASLPRISWALSSGVSVSVSTRSSGFSGTSYGSETPVNSLISPANAFA